MISILYKLFTMCFSLALALALELELELVLSSYGLQFMRLCVIWKLLVSSSSSWCQEWDTCINWFIFTSFALKMAKGLCKHEPLSFKESCCVKLEELCSCLLALIFIVMTKGCYVENQTTLSWDHDNLNFSLSCSIIITYCTLMFTNQ